MKGERVKRPQREQEDDDEGHAKPPKQKVLRSAIWKKLTQNQRGMSDKVLRSKWFGNYDDLEHEELEIQAWDWRGWAPDELVWTWRVKLSELARDSVQQTIQFKPIEDDQLEAMPFCTLQGDFSFSEVYPFELQFTDWRGAELKAADTTLLGTPTSSDPYVIFKIHAPLFPRKRGYAVGRRTRTEVQRNTLYPVWGGCRAPLFYTGTLAELENEALLIEVKDWDIGRHDTIGLAVVPMNGVLSAGLVQVGLALQEREPDTLEKVWVEYGSIQGFIHAKSMPKYSQVGQPVLLREGITYLAVKIVKANNLVPNDNKSRDAYFVVEWDGSITQTPVRVNNLDPEFNYYLHFPVKAQKITAHVLEKKGPIKVKCIDWSTKEELGKCQISLDKITSAFPARDSPDTTGKLYENTIPLVGGGPDTTVSLMAWFEPDIDIRLVSSTKAKPRELPKSYTERHRVWRSKFPKRADPSRLVQYHVSELDEDGVAHFLCEYVAPIPLPLEDQWPITPVTPPVVARMIRCIPFETDAELLSSPGKEVWMNPLAFMDVRKGDVDSHTTLLCSLFLGLQLDAYVCVGKRTGYQGQHVWVMTREPDGSVLFWETMKGHPLKLPQRWKGMFMDDILLDSPGEVEQVIVEEKKRNSDSESEEMSKEELHRLHQQELQLMIMDEDEYDDQCSPQVHADQQAPHGISEQEDRLSVSSSEEDLGLVSVPEAKSPYETLELVFNNQNVWANVQIQDPVRIGYDIEDDSQWSPFILPGSVLDEQIFPFYELRGTIGAALTPDRIKVLEANIAKDLQVSIKKKRTHKGLHTEFDNKLVPTLRKGLWKLEVWSARWKEVCKRDYDAWKGRLIAALPPAFTFEGTPACFYYTDPKRIASYLLSKSPYHEETTPGTKLVVAVNVVGYPMTTVAVWVYFAKLVPVYQPHLDKKRKKQQRAEKEAKAAKEVKAAKEARKAA